MALAEILVQHATRRRFGSRERLVNNEPQFKVLQKPPFFYSRTEKEPQRIFATNFLPKLSGELSGAICFKNLVLLGSALDLFRKALVLFETFFGFGVLFLALEREQHRGDSATRPWTFRQCFTSCGIHAMAALKETKAVSVRATGRRARNVPKSQSSRGSSLGT